MSMGFRTNLQSQRCEMEAKTVKREKVYGVEGAP